MKISLIITTYNRLDTLKAVIKSLCAQKNPGDIEILIADDGSTNETRHWLQQQKYSFPILHIWQPDEGFRAAQIRNRAAAKASGNYLIFIDGDCIVPNFFISRHKQLAEKKYYVTGNRILLTHSFTTEILTKDLPVYQWNFFQWLLVRLQGKCNRILPLLRLTKFPLYSDIIKLFSKQKWEGAKTCNLALWRDDFLAINGFDERYQGWGYEDSDLVIRLMRYGIQRKNSRFSIPVLHLWHAENDRSQESANGSLLETTLKNTDMVAKIGVSQYI